jgi:hypothetical protein
VQAETEDDARQQGDQITQTMIERKPGWPLLFSPWRDPKLTVCCPEKPDLRVPMGVVVTAGGKTFP